jgi:hypothetical protein
LKGALDHLVTPIEGFLDNCGCNAANCGCNDGCGRAEGLEQIAQQPSISRAKQ